MTKRSESCGVVRRSGLTHLNLAREQSCGSMRDVVPFTCPCGRKVMRYTETVNLRYRVFLQLEGLLYVRRVRSGNANGWRQRGGWCRAQAWTYQARVVPRRG